MKTHKKIIFIFLIAFSFVSSAFSYEVSSNKNEQRFLSTMLVKDILIQDALRVKSDNPAEYIQNITSKAVDYLRHSKKSNELSSLVLSIKSELEHSEIYLDQEQIINIIIEAVNS